MKSCYGTTLRQVGACEIMYVSINTKHSAGPNNYGPDFMQTEEF